ncbi:MAG: hypothetical protein B6U72_02970 [Candidatus Altiarchaeales archaeon ex4484_2]|nr:MAG: hypothetical protein B6U72_02970 [Candidatus Altiarchaeales archaeon ex4484_2]
MAKREIKQVSLNTRELNDLFLEYQRVRGIEGVNDSATLKKALRDGIDLWELQDLAGEYGVDLVAFKNKLLEAVR